MNQFRTSKKFTSLRRNLENLQAHLLDELDYRFSVIGITETKITNSAGINLNPHPPNYQYEQVTTPLSWHMLTPV